MTKFTITSDFRIYDRNGLFCGRLVFEPSMGNVPWKLTIKDYVLASFYTQEEAITWIRKQSDAYHSAREAVYGKRDKAEKRAERLKRQWGAPD
jgi:hypothetical protein